MSSVGKALVRGGSALLGLKAKAAETTKAGHSEIHGNKPRRLSLKKSKASAPVAAPAAAPAVVDIEKDWSTPLERAETDARAADHFASMQAQEASVADAKHQLLSYLAEAKTADVEEAREAVAAETAAREAAVLADAEAAAALRAAEASASAARAAALVAKQETLSSPLSSSMPNSSNLVDMGFPLVPPTPPSRKTRQAATAPSSGTAAVGEGAALVAPSGAAEETSETTTATRTTEEARQAAKQAEEQLASLKQREALAIAKAASEEAAAVKAAEAAAAARKAREEAAAREAAEAAAAAKAAEDAARARVAQEAAKAKAAYHVAMAKAAQEAAAEKAAQEAAERERLHAEAVRLLEERREAQRALDADAAAEADAQRARVRKTRRASQQLQIARGSLFQEADPIKLQAAIDMAVEAGVEASDVRQAKTELKKLLQARSSRRDAAENTVATRLVDADADRKPRDPMSSGLLGVIDLLTASAAQCAANSLPTKCVGDEQRPLLNGLPGAPPPAIEDASSATGTTDVVSPEAVVNETRVGAKIRRRAASQLQIARGSLFQLADPIKLQAAIDMAVEAGVEASDVRQAQSELLQITRPLQPPPPPPRARRSSPDVVRPTAMVAQQKVAQPLECLVVWTASITKMLCGPQRIE